MNNWIRKIIASALAFTIIIPSPALLAQVATSTEDDDEMLQEAVIELSPFEVSAGGDIGYAASSTLSGGRMGATAGGAQDINFFRSGAGRGEIPHPNTITAEGLFSEHDLPLDLGQTGEGLFIVQSAAIEADFPILPEVSHLAQIGFSSGLSADTWQRAPLNLVAVVDKSGSMSGHPLSLVRKSLAQIVSQLGDNDQLSIVLYGDRSHVYLPPTSITSANRRAVRRSIERISSAGSTNMEQGLEVGYTLAERSASQFDGNTRVMLFTDERPNVGNTSADGFMQMARDASHVGVGLTTIGVGVHFGAELATKISSVQGGNLFFFPDAAEMESTFTEDFDTMVTELAHDFVIRVKPRRGYRIGGVFGLPANMLRWDGDVIEFKVESIFLSKRKGGIYFAVISDESNHNPYLPTHSDRSGLVLADIDFTYRDATSGELNTSSTSTRVLSSNRAQAGLTRGRVLVDEFLTLRRAATAHLMENDQETAWRLVRDLRNRMSGKRDKTLRPEIDLVSNLHDTFAFLAGRTSAIKSPDVPSSNSPLVGTWINLDAQTNDQPFLVVWPDGSFEFGEIDLKMNESYIESEFVPGDPLSRRKSGTLEIWDSYTNSPHQLKYRIRGDQLTLELSQPNGKTSHLSYQRTTHAKFLASFEVEPEEDFESWPTVNSLTGLPAKS